MTMQPQHHDDELNVYELLKTVLDKKLLIAVMVLVLMVIGATLISFFPQSYRGSMVIRAVSDDVISKHSAINSTNLIGLNSFKVAEPLITKEMLLESFFVEARTYQQLKKAINKHSEKLSTFSGSDAGRAALVDLIADGYEIGEPTKTQDYYVLKVQASDKIIANKILNDAFQSINEAVQKNITTQIDDIKKSISNSIREEIIKAEDEIKLAELKYNAIVSKKVTFLVEQAAIARELGIEGKEGGDSAVSISLKKEHDIYLPEYYLHGYKAIEKEIALIKIRGNQELKYLYPDYEELEYNLEKLKIDRRIEEIDTALSLSPLQLGEFVAANYDVELIRYENRKKTIPLMIVLFLVSVTMSIIFVILVAGYKKYRLRESKSNSV